MGATRDRPAGVSEFNRAPSIVGRDTDAQQRETDLIWPIAEKRVEFGGCERRGKVWRLEHGRATEAADDLLRRRRIDLRRGGCGVRHDSQHQGKSRGHSSD